jgi:hypothetical protein
MLVLLTSPNISFSMMNRERGSIQYLSITLQIKGIKSNDRSYAFIAYSISISCSEGMRRWAVFILDVFSMLKVQSVMSMFLIILSLHTMQCFTRKGCNLENFHSFELCRHFFLIICKKSHKTKSLNKHNNDESDKWRIAYRYLTEMRLKCNTDR